jgi:MJ1316 RNA cyclic group end recognition domain
VNGILMVPLEAIRFPDGLRFVFELYDEEGEVYRIPFRRVRRVTRNGRVIWRRAPAREHLQEPG